MKKVTFKEVYGKKGEAKGEETKTEEAKGEETKTEEAKGEETKTEEAKGEETKTEEAKEVPAHSTRRRKRLRPKPRADWIANLATDDEPADISLRRRTSPGPPDASQARVPGCAHPIRF